MQQARLAPGQVLHGRYRVLERIGQGAVGAVYRVFDAVANQHRALKHLLPSAPSMHAQLAREAALLRRLRHPSLPRATDFFVEAGQPLLVMSLVPGPTLGQLVAAQAQPLGARMVLKWADELLDALEYLHVRGIVHHDVKPRNVKLDGRGRAVLIDFGLAQQRSIRLAPCASGYTATYAPPEQVRGEPTDARSDVYALGATVYELLARRSPPPALHRASALDGGGCDPLMPLDQLEADVPGSVQAAIGRALALDPAQRPADAREMRQELREGARACIRRAASHRVHQPLIVSDAQAATVPGNAG